MPCSAASDLGLHCLPITLLWVSRLQWLNTEETTLGLYGMTLGKYYSYWMFYLIGKILANRASFGFLELFHGKRSDLLNIVKCKGKVSLTV